MWRFYPFAILLVTLLCQVSACGQGSQAYFERYTIFNGLVQNSIKSICQDQKGFLWFGSEDGASRFDGMEFKNYTRNWNEPASLANNRVVGLTSLKSGQVLISTEWGVSEYMPATNNFIIHDIRGPGHNSYLFNKATKTAIDKDSDIWVSSFKCLSHFNKKWKLKGRYYTSLKKDSLGTEIISLSEKGFDAKGNIWIRSYNGIQLFNTAGKYFYNFSDNPFHWKCFRNEVISALFVASDGTIWYSAWSEGLFHFYPETNQLVHYNSKNDKNPVSLDNDVIYSILEAHDGSIWLGCNNTGLCRINPADGAFSVYQNSLDDLHSLSSNTVNALFEDKQQNLWIGTENGICKLRLNEKVFFSYHKELYPDHASDPFVLTGLSLDKENILWVSVYGRGLFKLDRKTGGARQFLYKGDKPESSHMNSNYIWTIYDDGSGKIWVCTQFGLKKFDKKSETFENDLGLPGELGFLKAQIASVIFRDHKGNYWIGTWRSGLIKYDPGTGIVTRFFKPGNTNPDFGEICISAIYEDSRNNIWIGHNDDFGISCLKNGEGTPVNIKSGAPDHKNLIQGTITGMCETKNGNLVIGTRTGGIAILNPATGYIVYITRAEGLPSDFTSCLLRDNLDNIWIGTPNGLVRFDAAFLKFEVYNSADVLPGTDVQNCAIIDKKTGELFFCTPNHIVYFNPALLKPNTMYPDIAFTGFRVFGKERPFDFSKPIILNYDDNDISVGFTALNFIEPEKNQYAWKMEGVDKDWNNGRSARLATYGNLSPGRYSFRVKAANNDGIWNDKGIKIDLIIRPAWWQTWWFRLLVALLTGGLGYSLYGFRQMRQRAVLEMRNQIARDLHDDMGSTLSNISILSETGNSEVNFTEKMQKIGDIARDMMGSMDDIVWSVSPGNDTLENLAVRMRMFASELFEGKNIDFDISFPDNFEKVQLKMKHRKELYLIFKEALNNLVKYSGCSFAEVAMDYSNHRLVLKIKDDGIGFLIHEVELGNGLMNMKARAKTLGGDLAIKSVPGAGTEIILNVYIP